MVRLYNQWNSCFDCLLFGPSVYRLPAADPGQRSRVESEESTGHCLVKTPSSTEVAGNDKSICYCRCLCWMLKIPVGQMELTFGYMLETGWPLSDAASNTFKWSMFLMHACNFSLCTAHFFPAVFTQLKVKEASWRKCVCVWWWWCWEKGEGGSKWMKGHRADIKLTLWDIHNLVSLTVSRPCAWWVMADFIHTLH